MIKRNSHFIYQQRGASLTEGGEFRNCVFAKDNSITILNQKKFNH